MTQEEENLLREENRALREQVSLQQKHIGMLQEKERVQEEVIGALQRQLSMQEQEMSLLKQQVQELQERLKKDSHNSHLPPSSDRFARQPKSLRKKSDKPSGGQQGHPGHHLIKVATPDQIVVHTPDICCACQH